MPNDENIGYLYGSIDEGHDAMMRVNKEVERLIETLTTETGTALDHWTGAAADGYRELSADIRKNFADMNDIVHKLAVELRESAERMKLQDQTSGKSFHR